MLKLDLLVLIFLQINTHADVQLVVGMRRRRRRSRLRKRRRVPAGVTFLTFSGITRLRVPWQKLKCQTSFSSSRHSESVSSDPQIAATASPSATANEEAATVTLAEVC